MVLINIIQLDNLFIKHLQHMSWHPDSNFTLYYSHYIEIMKCHTILIEANIKFICHPKCQFVTFRERELFNVHCCLLVLDEKN